MSCPVLTPDLLPPPSTFAGLLCFLESNPFLLHCPHSPAWNILHQNVYNATSVSFRQILLYDCGPLLEGALTPEEGWSDLGRPSQVAETTKEIMTPQTPPAEPPQEGAELDLLLKLLEKFRGVPVWGGRWATFGHMHATPPISFLISKMLWPWGTGRDLRGRGKENWGWGWSCIVMKEQWKVVPE